MNLHRNAALSWQGRRRMARRVVEQGWTLGSAAEAAGVSVRCAHKWATRYRLEGEVGLHDRSSAPRRVANRTAPERIDAIRKLRRLRFTAAEIAEVLGMALTTVSGILTRLGIGQARPDRPRARRALRALTSRRARARRRQEARTDPGRRGKASPRRYPAALQPQVHRCRRQRAPQRRLGVRAYRRRRPQPACLRRGAPPRASRDRGRLSRTRSRLLRSLRDHGRAPPNRQRRLLLRHAPRTGLPTPRHPPPAHTALPATNKRESGALHSHPARRLGIRRHLSLEPRTHSRP